MPLLGYFHVASIKYQLLQTSRCLIDAMWEWLSLSQFSRIEFNDLRRFFLCHTLGNFWRCCVILSHLYAYHQLDSCHLAWHGNVLSTIIYIRFALINGVHPATLSMLSVSAKHMMWFPRSRSKIRSLRQPKRPEIGPRRWENDKKMMSR